MASRQSSAGRATRSAGSRRLTAAAQQAVERAQEAKRRVREAKAELKSLRKLAKAAKKAAKAALKKAKAAQPAKGPKSPRKRTAARGPGRQRQAAEVAHSVIRRMRKDESAASRATQSAVALPDPAGNETQATQIAAA